MSWWYSNNVEGDASGPRERKRIKVMISLCENGAQRRGGPMIPLPHDESVGGLMSNLSPFLTVEIWREVEHFRTFIGGPRFTVFCFAFFFLYRTCTGTVRQKTPMLT